MAPAPPNASGNPTAQSSESSGSGTGYGVMDNDPSVNCPVISAPGTYVMPMNYSGAPNGDNCVMITASNVVFNCNGFTIAGSAWGAALSAINVSGSPHNVTVENCNIHNYTSGIYVGAGSLNLYILNNNVSETDNDIWLDWASSANVYNNSVYESGPGIHVNDDPGVVNIYDNTVERDAPGILTEADNANIYNNFIEHNSFGGIEDEGFADIYNNTADYNGYGIELDIAIFDTVHDNHFDNNLYAGIYAYDGQENVIYDNTANNNSLPYYGVGIALTEESINNTLYNNTVDNDVVGIWLGGANSNVLYNNTAYNNSQYGILLSPGTLSSARNNTLYNNTLTENGYYDLAVQPYIPADCQNNITSTTGSAGRPINYSYVPVSWNGLNSAEIELCNATGSNVTNTRVNGSDSLNNDAFLVYETNNAVIKNTSSSYNYIGFDIESSLNGVYANNSANSNGLYGFYLASSSQNTISNNTVMENDIYDLLVSPGSAAGCPNTIANMTGSAGRPVNYSYAPVSWNGLNSAEIELCNATGSNVTNTRVNGSDTLNNDAFLVYYTNNAAISNISSRYNYAGFDIESSANGTYVNNSLNNNGMYGIYMYSANQNNLSNDNAGNSGNYGIYMNGANQNNLYNISADNSSNYGVYLASSNNNLSNVSADNSGNYSIYLASSNNNVLSNVNADNSSNYGIYVYNANQNSFYNVSADKSNNSITLEYATATSFYNTTASNSSNAGLLLFESDQTLAQGMHFFNNNPDLRVEEVEASPYTMNLSGLIFDNPLGNMQNYTNLSINDTWVSEEYSINWTGSPAPLPSGNSSFAQTFVNISAINDSTSIDSIVWSWTDAESAAYIENTLSLWKYNGTWTRLNNTPDTTADTLGIQNLDPASDYAVLGNPINCPVVSAPGAYMMSTDYTGSPNDAVGTSVIGFSCVKIAASNVLFDCNGHSITGTDSADVAYGVVINGSAANVTVQNCVVSNYTIGISNWYSSYDRFLNDTAYNNSENGIAILASPYSIIANSTSFNNSNDGIVTTSQNSAINHNTAYNNMGIAGISVEASNVTCTGNTAYSNTGPGINVDAVSGTTISNSSVYDNEYGIFVLFSNATYLANNTAHDDSFGYHIYVDNGTVLTGNSAANEVEAFYIYESTNTTLTNNTAIGSNSGFNLVLSNSTVLTANTVGTSSSGFTVGGGTPNTTLTNNTVFGSATDGFDIYTSATLTNDVAYDNQGYGIFISESNATLSGGHLYNNGADIVVADTSGPNVTIGLSGIVFDNPAGNYQNYTNLSIADNVTSGELYSVSWSSNSSSLPYNTISFAQMFVNIATLSGPVSIDSIVWSWNGSVLIGYNATRFGLWKYNGTWTLLNNTPDNVANTLGLANLNPGSIYGILQNTTPLIQACNISVQVDGVTTTTFPDSAVPYAVSVVVTDNLSSPLAGMSVSAGEENGRAIFYPVINPFEQFFGAAYATTNSSGGAEFAAAPTRYNIPDGYGYVPYIEANGSGYLCIQNLSIASYGSLVPTYRSSLVNSAYGSEVKASIQNMNALASTATKWIGAKKMREADVTLYTNGTYLPLPMLQSGAPNRINISVYDNNTISLVIANATMTEQNGQVVFVPQQPGKDSYGSSKLFQTNETQLVIPTMYNNPATVSINVSYGNATIAILNFSVNGTLGAPSAGEATMDDASYSQISSGMQNIISVLVNIGKSMSTV